jgi:hypothetical protein
VTRTELIAREEMLDEMKADSGYETILSKEFLEETPKEAVAELSQTSFDHCPDHIPTII